MAKSKRRFGAIKVGRACPREGMKVRYNPNAASHALYSGPPARGEVGQVVSVPLGGGRRKTCMPGPGGGLVYVRWERKGVMGISPIDLDKA